MARISRRFSRYFSRSSHTTPQKPKICKSQISRPITTDEDTQPLTTSNLGSSYSLSDQALRALEEERLTTRLDDDIDDILAQYQYTPTRTPTRTNAHVDLGMDVQIHIEASNPTHSVPHPASPSPHPSPPARSSRIERFHDTPPPAPSWEKVSFGRQTRLFGPENFMSFGAGVKSGSHKDWRGEFGRRGYAVL